MKKEEEKLSNRLYLRFTFLLLALFFCILLFIFILMSILLLTPIGRLAMHGLGSITIVFLLCSYAAVTFISCFISFFYLKKIFRPLIELSSKSMKVAQGDFNVSVREDSTLPELQQTLINFNIMVKELSKVETLSNDFVSNVSHEFKTPLSVIRSNVNILQNAALDELEKQKCLSVINDSVEKLSTLISNVLKICKLDTQEVKTEISSYRLDEQLRQLILSFADELERKNINLDLSLDDCIIENDKDLLNQVWTNILSNAIKFSNDNGTIAVELKLLANEISVKISDDGIGMDEETKKHVFDRFYQGDTSHARDGNGLGLTIVGKVVRLCQGHINVESKLNKGSTFTVSLPRSIKK